MNIESAAEDILLHLECSKFRPSDMSPPIPLKYFDCAETLVYFDAFGNDKGLLRMDIEPHEIPEGRLDVSAIVKDSRQGAKFQVLRARRIPAKDLRGRIRVVPPWLVESTAASLYENGEYHVNVPTHVGFVGGDWVEMPIPPKVTQRVRGGVLYTDTLTAVQNTKTQTEYRNSTKVAVALEVARWEQWAVLIGVGGPRLRFASDPTAILELFRLRDAPPGKKRRASLTHWVAEHHRKNRNDPGALIEVRKHLRGAADCSWNGMTVEIRPARRQLEALWDDGLALHLKGKASA